MKAVVTFGALAVSLLASSSSFAAPHARSATAPKKAGPAVVAKKPAAATPRSAGKPTPKRDTKVDAKRDTKVDASRDTKVDAKVDVKAEAKDAKRDRVASSGTMIINASTRSTKPLPQLPVKPPCLREPIAVLAHLNEEDKFALTRCDGSPAPAALEHLSVAMRPGSAPKPTTSILELAKVKDTNFAPGVRRRDPLLVERLQTVVDHFTKSGKSPRVVVISGYRPSSTGSYHASGRALDFRLDGVRNEELVSFCKTLPDTGCGYYPNSFFIHLDIRDPGTGHTTWIDASGPGEKPRYVSAWPPPATPADRPIESTSDALAQLERMSKGEAPPFPIDEHPALPAHAAPIAVPGLAKGAAVVTGTLGENPAEEE
jgi:hypothetical protein